eukprot:TRINITY_DN11995_c0_g1_i2.p2 TRINITY_DN11995_c0_g1~~TRINITY_DN11995_c0_g1_i2.p2  ORF type:complete len:442 (+),score=176.42 TRINITY_DN11995_c0_g1_i2:58-1383(+)
MRKTAALAAALLPGVAVATCPTPATVSHVEGVTALPHTAGSFPWLPSPSTVLHVPPSMDPWMTCASWYVLGADSKVGMGTTATVTCSVDVCDVYAFLYHEPPRSSNFNGDLTEILPDDDWTPGSCAPTFSLAATPDDKCRMTAFRKKINNGETASVAVDNAEDAHYLVLAVAPGVHCDDNGRDTQSTCTATDGTVAVACKWTQSGCVDDWCSRRHGTQTPRAPPGRTTPGGSETTQQFCSAPLDQGRTASLFNTGVGADGSTLLQLHEDDPHWEVKMGGGAWVQAKYGKTNNCFSCNTPGPFDWPIGNNAVSRPGAHPSRLNAQPQPNTVFSWRTQFELQLGDVVGAMIKYQIGFDDYSKNAGGGNHGTSCAHTVWLNGLPHAMPAVTAGPATPQRYYTLCEGTLNLGFNAGVNTLEFRIQNVNSYYGFRFEKLTTVPAGL